ncbi:hypothetical protein DID80_08230, partial [Candidatus Marinamargulisbacteria bacterium SCGC AAA071-K20]
MSILNKHLKKGKTLLCTGPMSKNCIDAAVEISEELKIPQILIASRRQIDSKEFGGGYVENFSTEEFSDYIKSKNSSYIYMARDHGGPWQSVKESTANMPVKDAMESAKRSFEVDILNDFNFIHIDPSVPIQNETLSLEVIIERLFELYEHCFQFARKNNKEIEFELGTEEQNGYTQDLDAFEYFLEKTQSFCKKNNIKAPTFVVAQTGTKVMETENVGIFPKTINDAKQISFDHLKSTIKLCEKYNLNLKEHNTDYQTY